MRVVLALCFTALVSGCAYNTNCIGPGVTGTVAVSPDSLDFYMVLPEGVQSVWVRYGTDIYRMGIVSEKSTTGEVRIRKLKPDTVYYWQITQQRKCGIVRGRIYQNRTVYTAQIHLK